MSKRKKTRQQKIIADLRRQVHITKKTTTDTTLQSAYEDRPYVVPEKFTPPKNISMQTYSAPYEHTHLQKDVRKTMILTSSIVACELLLFFLVQNRIVSLPFVN